MGIARGSVATEPQVVDVGNAVLEGFVPRRDHAPEPRPQQGRRTRDRGWLMRRALAAADVAALTVAFAVSLVAFGGSGSSNAVADAVELGIFFLSMPFWVVVAKLYGLYSLDEERTDHSTADDLMGVFHLVTVGSWLLFAFVTLTGLANPSVMRVVTFWLVAIVLVTASRALVRVLVRHSRAFVQDTIIVGAGDVGQLLARKILQHPEYGINVVGFVDADPRERDDRLGELTLLGPPSSLPELVDQHRVDRVIIAFSNETHQETLDLVRMLEQTHVRVDIVPRLFEVLGTEIGVHTVEGIPLIGLPDGKLSRSSLLLKRTFDTVVACGALLFFVPVLVCAAIAIKLDSRGPILFRQIRMGAGGETFTIYKFRTMRADADERKEEVAHLNKHATDDPRMFKIPHDPRVTRVGAVLRRYSIDELPQLLNVLRGEMSVVGPRPLILEEDRYVVDWRRRRLNLKPGITGLWQVLGRDGIPFDEMVKLDYLYVSTWSILNDVKLIMRTIPVMFRSHAC